MASVVILGKHGLVPKGPPEHLSYYQPLNHQGIILRGVSSVALWVVSIEHLGTQQQKLGLRKCTMMPTLP
jgi:hypothetical protein